MITVKNLTKAFGPKMAVDNLSFSVPKGQILGFLGPNGAGKSTTMRMLTGFITPTSGVIEVDHLQYPKDSLEIRKRLGYLPENAASYGEMTVGEFLNFIADIRKINSFRKPNDSIAQSIITQAVGAVWHQSIQTLSKGYKQRVGFAQALIHDPDILILDEPTDGLDPNQKQDVRTLIKEMGKRKTIILSTHILEEVDALCERVIIINQGRLVADATPMELKAQSIHHNAVTIRGLAQHLEAIKEHCEKLDYAERVEFNPEQNLVKIFAKNRQVIAERLKSELEISRLTYQEIYVDLGHLDDVFRQLTLGS